MIMHLQRFPGHFALETPPYLPTFSFKSSLDIRKARTSIENLNYSRLFFEVILIILSIISIDMVVIEVIILETCKNSSHILPKTFGPREYLRYSHSDCRVSQLGNFPCHH